MTGHPSYTIRPLSKPTNEPKEAFHVYLKSNTLYSHGLKAGDVCLIWKDGSQNRKAIAWPSKENIKGHIVQTSRFLQSTYNFRLGDQVFISKDESPVIIAIQTAYLEEISPPDGNKVIQVEGAWPDDEDWESFLKEHLEKYEIVVPGMDLEGLSLNGRQRSLRVKYLDDRNGKPQILGKFDKASRVKIIGADTVGHGAIKRFKLSATGIGGLGTQIHDINEVLEDIDNPNAVCPSWLGRPGGLLLYGSAGTGKSTLLEKIAETGWDKVFIIETFKMSRNINEATSNIRNIFAEARCYPRSVIIIDELDRIASKGSPQYGEVNHSSTLLSELRALKYLEKRAKVLVAAATCRINDIDDSLRRHDGFEFQIEIPVPDANARIEIVKCIAKVPISEADIMLEKLGERTHGFTRSDLYDLMHLAGRESGRRQRRLGLQAQSYSPVNGETDANELAQREIDGKGHCLAQEDIDKALLRIRPTAMREIFLEVPKVRWSDIGGQEHVKQSLREAIEWPLTDPAQMQRLGLRAKKGLLLYGPPGCSKTLTAKALATESGLNFIAVKGAEILSMYVGESERKLRDIFSKARAASPSIIFFDEIDAIASSREGSQTGGLNVLTTLLNEMDGIEALRGVTVLAATNKPEMLDLALMRPGRLDTILYVGLPDLDARREILSIELTRMDVAQDVNIYDLAQEMDGYTGAEIVSVCHQAGYRAFRDFKDTGKEEQISRRHFDYALSQVKRQVTPELRLAYEQWTVGGIEKM